MPEAASADINEAVIAETAERIAQRLVAGETLVDMGDIGPKELEAVYAMGHSLFGARKYDKAAALFRFLAMAEHNNPRWWFALGVTEQHGGRFEAAVNAFAMATLLDVEDPRPQAQAGYCLLALDKVKEARSALEGALIVCENAPASPANDAVAAQARQLLDAAKGRLEEKR